MKRNLKTRLTLHRETLRTLDGDDLTAAPGGFPPIVQFTYSCYRCVTYTCPTRCDAGCTTTTC